MKLKNLVKACSKDKARTSLHNVNVRRAEDGSVTCEATDGHIAVALTYAPKDGPAWLATLAPGQYTPDDWVDLVCKGRTATPVPDALTFPDLEQAIPRDDAGFALVRIGINLALVNVLSSILDTAGATFMFTSDIGPIRIDHRCPGDGGVAVAVIMPWKLP